MTVIKTILELEKSEEYTSWKKNNEKSYLVHAFKMDDDANKNIWQIGYFNPETHLITVFEITPATITKHKDAEVYKEQEKLVNALLLSDVKVEEDVAYEKGLETLKTVYKVDVYKSFMILQNLEEVNQVWNITFITNNFKTVNVKVDTKTGEVVAHKTVSLIADQ